MVIANQSINRKLLSPPSKKNKNKKKARHSRCSRPDLFPRGRGRTRRHIDAGAQPQDPQGKPAPAFVHIGLRERTSDLRIVFFICIHHSFREGSKTAYIVSGRFFRYLHTFFYF